MAWLLGDGFDFYSALSDAANNTVVWSGDSFSFVLLNQGGTRTGLGNCMLLGNNSANPGNMSTAQFTDSATIFVNMGVRSNQTHVDGGTTKCVGFSWLDAGNKNGGLFLRNGGDFVITSGGINDTVLVTSGVICPTASTWHHIQAKIVVHPSAGSVELRVNGNTTADFFAADINTRNLTANNYANGVNISSSSATADFFDDFYVFNDQGGHPNTWQGDVLAVQHMPTEDNAVAWTRSGGTNNCLQVDDPRQDGDTSYVFTNTLNAIDTYGLAAFMTTPAGIIAVAPKYAARMDGGGPHQVQVQLTSGATTVTLPVLDCTNLYQFRQQVYPVDPNTSSLWSAAAVNALLLHIKDIL